MDLSQLIKLKNKNLILENVDGTPIGVITARDITLSLRFNSISEITFTCDEENCNVFKMVTSYKVITLQDVGKFIIENPTVTNNGMSLSKTVTCRSYEIDINRKTIPYLNGTYKFYSILPEDETIMSIIMSYLPNWTIESIDNSLWNTYRTYDLTDIPLLQFIRENVSSSFECVFMFNTLQKTIKVLAYENIQKDSDIYLSFNNLVTQLDITETTENLCTALTVRGVDLSVNLVNPLGTSTIYNFDHFLNAIDDSGIGFMSNSLKSAINGWRGQIDLLQPDYTNYLNSRATKLSELIVLQTALTELENQLTSLVGVRDALLESGQDATSQNTLVKNKQTEIDNKEVEITAKQAETDTIDVSLKTINDTIAFDKYFTPEQLLEIEPYVIQRSVTDEHFVAGSADSLLTKQNTAMDLYNKYKNWLSKNAKLQYEFSIDLINFIEQSEYDLFTSQLDWGITVTVDNGNKTVSYPMLQGLDIQLDGNDDTVQFLFGTNMRFSSATDSYEDFLANQVSNAISSVSGSSVKWGEYVNSGSRDKVENLFKVGLQADLTEVSNGANQEVVMNASGLMGRKLVDGIFDNRQWKMINNKLLFTDDGWNTAKLAIGQITLPDLSKAYGINAEILMGNLVATNQLIVKNESNSFIVDADSATLTNAILNIIGNSGLNKIVLDPTNGFKIQKLINEVWTDVVYLDSEGNAVFNGKITGGSIDINQNFLVDSNGNVSLQGTLNVAGGKITVDDLGNLYVEGIINASDIQINGVSILTQSGLIDSSFISGGVSGSAIFKSMIVDQLSTSDKIINYLNSNTAEVNYIFVHDQYIDFYTEDTVNGSEQAKSNADGTGLPVYWVLADIANNIPAKTYITTEITTEPVMQYTYANKLKKASYGFEFNGTNYVPKIVMGSGTGNTVDSGKTFIYKETDGFYIEYKHSVTGLSSFIKITDDGIDLSQFPKVTYAEGVVMEGEKQVWVQTEIPLQAKIDDVWIDYDDYTRYDKKEVAVDTVLVIADFEEVIASGTIAITLHETTTAGIIKKIYNTGTGIITIVGTINEKTNMLLFPNESVELITDGTQWRY